MQARGWIYGVAQAACRSANTKLAGSQLGYHHWPARIANDALALRAAN